MILHTRADNQEDFKKIWQEGVCIHGLGQLSKAMSSVLLKKLEGFEEHKKALKQLTIITIEEKREVINSIIEAASDLSIQENIHTEDLLEVFFTEYITTHILCSQYTFNDESDDFDFRPEIKFLSKESSPEEIEQAYRENEIHFLGMPGEFVNDTIKKIEEVVDGEEKIYIDPAKGAHEIAEGVRGKVVRMSGPNFADEILLKKPTGTNLSGEDKEKTNDIMKLIWSDTIRPYLHKNPEAIKMAGEWKNVLAVMAGFLTHNKVSKRKTLIMPALFIKMLEWGEKVGIDKNDLLDLSGIGDFFLCMNEKSRNFKAGTLIHEIDFNEIKSWEDLVELVKEELPEDKRTVEGLYTLGKYIKDPTYNTDSLIKMFKTLSSEPRSNNHMEILCNDESIYLSEWLHGNIEEEKIKIEEKSSQHKFIRTVARVIKEIMKKTNTGKNTEALLIARSIPEIKRALKIEELSNNDIYKILQYILEISFETSPKTKHMKGIIQLKTEETMPILTAVSEALNSNLDKEILLEIERKLMDRPIKIND